MSNNGYSEEEQGREEYVRQQWEEEQKAEAYRQYCEEMHYRGEMTKDISINRVEEICTAEREGRCVILPCNVSDTVWDRHGRAWTITQAEQHLYGRMWFRCGHKGTDDYMAFSDEDIGESIFLQKPVTREAAEAALTASKENMQREVHKEEKE